MKCKITTIAIITIFVTAMFPVTNASTADTIRQVTSIPSSSQPMPEQKISSVLLEELENIGLDYSSASDSVRILIRHSPDVMLKLPEGVEVLRRFKLVPIVSAVAPLSKIEEIAKVPGVEYVYPDLKVQVSNDEYPELPYPDYSKIRDWKNAEQVTEKFPYNPWIGEYPCFLNESTELIGARQLWEQNITGEGVIIAVIDTGINKQHPDLDDMDDDPTTCDPKVLAEASFIEEPFWEVGDPNDYAGHGTHCASIAAGTGATGGMGFYGISLYPNYYSYTILPGTERGVAPGAYLYNAKALNAYGYGYDSWIIAAIEWSVEHGADILSCSWGGWPLVPPDEDPIVLAMRKAIEHGVVVVVAAGNEGWGYFSLGSPGFAPDVITVGATTETDHLFFFSSRGPEQFGLHAKPDVCAPGICVVAAFTFFREFEEDYGFQTFYLEISGTSMSTPHVAGSAALLLQEFPGATPHTVKSALMLGADDLELDPMTQGAGRVNVKRAYDIMSAAPTVDWTAPLPTNTVVPSPPLMMAVPNLTGIDILVEASLCNPGEFSSFIDLLEDCDATIWYGFGPYLNDTLVDPFTNRTRYDVFIIPEPRFVDLFWLDYTVLAHYVKHNGTVLFIGDYPYPPFVPKDYNKWTEQWDITWNNTALGGLSTNIAPHAITSGITEVYFGNPIASLIIGTEANCVIWDPLFPGVLVWQASAPSKGKAVVISDDAVLNDQFLYTADNLQLGLNIIKWFTEAPPMYLVESSAERLYWIESPHPYPSDAWLEYYIWEPGASWISVHFPIIDVETNWDYVDIYDKNWNLITSYTGHYEDVWTPPVPGDLAIVVLTSDFIIEWWGFIADRYKYGTLVPQKPNYHEIGVGGTWTKYVMANSSIVMTVDVYNFGNFTEDVQLYMSVLNCTNYPVIDMWNFKNVTDLAPGATATVDASCLVTLNATLFCELAGTCTYKINIWGTITDPEIDYTNNGFLAEVAAVPKTERTGPNPLLSVMTPMKIESTSAPLITMYPKDFTLHNVTAFVSGGELINAEFKITGDVAEIADFINVTKFTEHYYTYMWIDGIELVPDPSPAYFIPNMTAILGDTIEVGNTLAPTMLFAEFQVYITADTTPKTYTGKIELLNGTTAIASTDLSFEVRAPKYKVLWEDYYNDYWGDWWDCERLWGGAYFGLGVFEWWKLVSSVGFDVDSLHQQTYFRQHIGYLGAGMVDPMGVIAYGGYECLYMHDVDFYFRDYEISVFRQLYETGKMDFIVLFDGGSEMVDQLTRFYGITAGGDIWDLVITGFDREHPIFTGVENFTMLAGPTLIVDPSLATGIATGTDDWGLDYASGFVVAVSEMQATPHLTSRMAAFSDSNMFEFLEYTNFWIWLYTWRYPPGAGEVITRTDTDKVAVNLLEWLDPQFANKPPIVDYVEVTPTTVKPGETVSVDVLAHDPEDDDFTVTISVKRPDNTWDNATVPCTGGHWLREFTANLEGTYKVYAVVTDQYGASTTMLGGTVKAVNLPPEITFVSISPSKVTQGETTFITVGAKDFEDIVLVKITMLIVAPNGSVYDYEFTSVAFASLKFDSTGMPEGVYKVSAIAEDILGANTSVDMGFFEVKLPLPPEITSVSISPSRVTEGQTVFITVGCEDPEDIIPTKIVVTITAPDGSTYNYTFTGARFADVQFDSSDMPEGVYKVGVSVTDTHGAETREDVGFFEVKLPPAPPLPIKEIGLGVGIVGLVALVAIVLMIRSLLVVKKSKSE